MQLNFIINGEVSMWVKNSWAGHKQKNKQFCFHKLFVDIKSPTSLSLALTRSISCNISCLIWSLARATATIRSCAACLFIWRCSSRSCQTIRYIHVQTLLGGVYDGPNFSELMIYACMDTLYFFHCS